MTFDDVYETLPADGWLSKDEARLLWKSAKDVPGAILEVGCYHGRSTVLLASFGRVVHAVDPFEGFSTDDMCGDRIFAAFERNLQDRAITNVVLYTAKIENWRPRPVGFAYLDGDHTPAGTIAQIEVARKCHAQVIGIHDVNDSGDGAKIKEVAIQLLGRWTERVGRMAIWMV